MRPGGAVLTTCTFDRSIPSFLAKNSNITKFVVELAAASCLPSRSLTDLISGREVTTVPQKSNRLNRYFTLTPRASARPTVSTAALPPTLNSPELNCVVYASGGRSTNSISSPCAVSSFCALITGGIKPPSDGKPNTTMVTFAGACAAAGADIANAANANAAIALNASRRIGVILFVLQVVVSLVGLLALVLLLNSE